MNDARAHKRRRGFTLIELALVMGVIGSIMGAIWWAASNTREAQRGNDAVSELQNVQQTILNMLQGQTLSYAAGTNITAALITAQAIPSAFIDKVNNTTADNPWSPGNFMVYGEGTRTIRISFYKVSRSGCTALLLGATGCQAGQAGCPSAVYTDGVAGSTPAKSCTPALCNGTTPTSNIGWQVMGSSVATSMCSSNNYGGGTNSVEFDFPL